VLYLLATCQKYKMASVQASIRVEFGREKFSVRKGAEVFRAYAIASANKLILEMVTATLLTLDQPMTFEILGKELRLFKDSALQDLVSFRKRCRDSFVACLDSFIKVQSIQGPSIIWVDCPEDITTEAREAPILRLNDVPPRWLNQFLSQMQNGLRLQKFTCPLDIRSRICMEYTKALQNHATCNSCLRIHLIDGPKFCTSLEHRLILAFYEVTHSLYFSSTRDSLLVGTVIAALLGLTYSNLRNI
jgi:hypothetical protein